MSKTSEPECQAIDYGPYSYGSQYPCRRKLGHKGPHECLDKDDCPHTWPNKSESAERREP